MERGKGKVGQEKGEIGGVYVLLLTQHRVCLRSVRGACWAGLPPSLSRHESRTAPEQSFLHPSGKITN